MSGEKTGTWSLAAPGDPTAISWAEGLEALERYRAKAEDLERALVDLAASHQDLRVEVAKKPRNGALPETGEALIEELNLVQAWHNALLFELRHLQGVLEQRDRFNSLVGVALPEVAATSTRWQALRKKLLAIPDKLDPAVDEKTKAAVKALYRMAISLPEARISTVEVHLASLNTIVNEANPKARTAAALKLNGAREATKLLVKLQGERDPAAETVISKLEMVQAGELAWSDPLRAEAQAAVKARVARRGADERRRKAAEREEAAEILSSSLRRLGYVPDRGFKTAFVGGGETLFKRKDWGDYWCQLTVDAQTQGLGFRVVREGENAPASLAADTAKEREWCTSFAELEKILAQKGLPLNITKREAVGAGAHRIKSKQGVGETGVISAGALGTIAIAPRT